MGVPNLLDVKQPWCVEFIDTQEGVLVRMKSDAANTFVIADLAMGVISAADRDYVKRYAAQSLTADELGELLGLIISFAMPSPERWNERVVRLEAWKRQRRGGGIVVRKAEGNRYRVLWKDRQGRKQSTPFSTEDEAAEFAGLIVEEAA